jgi:DNA-binding PadR family transcriptional regulator
MKGNHIGEFEELVLLAVYSIDGEAYGVPLQEKLEQLLERSISIGAVYAALGRLERKGLVTSWVGDPSSQRGGRRKRHFEITPVGVAALKQVRRARERIWREIET